MDLQTVINKRMLEQARQKVEQDRQKEIDELKQSGRELSAQAIICQWIEQVYGISLHPSQLTVAEKRFIKQEQACYSLRIDLSDDAWIQCNRDMIIRFADDKAYIEGHVGDEEKGGLFGSAWTAHDRRLSDTFSDLVEAAIFATGATLDAKVEVKDVYEEIP